MDLRKNFLLLVVLVVSFLLLAISIINKNGFIIMLDQNVASFVANIRFPALDTIMIFITNLGEMYEDLVLLVIFAIFLLIKHKKHRFYALMIATSLGIASAEVIKISVGRARPLSDLISETGYSFPSIHATISTIFLLSIVFLMVPLIQNIILKRIAFITTLVIFPLIALSRIYLSVHFTSDIIAGIVLGLICYFASFILIFHKHIDIAVK